MSENQDKTKATATETAKEKEKPLLDWKELLKPKSFIPVLCIFGFIGVLELIFKWIG